MAPLRSICLLAMAWFTPGCVAVGPREAPSAPAEESPRPEEAIACIDDRARTLAAEVRADPAPAADLFADQFRSNVPDAALRRLLAETWSSEGEVTSVRRVRVDSPTAARFEFAFSRGGVLQCDLRLSPEPPHAIRYLWLFRSLPGFDSLEDAAAALGTVCPDVTFAVDRLAPGAAARLAGKDPDRALEVASAFKLYVLGALIDDVRAGRRSWSDTVRLEPRLRSIPTGILHRWPDGAPVTLHSLASLMIERSDNTATDHLLDLLGRERVEDMQRAMGHADPGRNVPFLTTGEMFRLKYADGGRHVSTWAALDADGRRRFLADVVAPMPLDRIDSPSGSEPRGIGTIGWFASAADLSRAMDWIRRATEAGEAAAARGILAIEPGTSQPPDVFPYQAFKGGRLPGVVGGTWLVRSGAGEWYAVSATVNDPRADPDEARFRGILTRALQVLGRE